MKSATKIVQERKYRISRTENQISIKRKVNDVWDLVGFVPFKRLALAIGKINREETSTILDLEIKIDQLFEFLFVASIVFFGCVSIWIMTKDFGAGLIFLFLLGLIAYLQYLIFNKGLNGFYSDLKTDIEYFN